MENKKELKSVSFKCEGCGSGLVFSPKTQNLKCQNCGREKELEKSCDVQKHDLNEAKEEKHQKWMEQNKILKCQTCGAEIILNSLEFSGICPYCNSSYVAETKNLPDFVPDKVLPFLFDENEAEKRFKTQIKRRFYVPSSCKKTVKPENIKGTYIPAFSFDAFVSAEYSGTLSRQNDKDVVYFSISGTHKKEIKDVLIENSSKITQESLKKILPYDLEKGYKFSEGFVLGYVVEHYEDAFNVCLNKSIKEMEQKMKTEILSKYSYDSVREFNMHCDFSNRKYLYSIVPIYQMNFFYRKRKYNILMNGQTGKIGGKFPTSVLKVLLTVLVWLLIVAGIIIISSLN